MSTKGTIHVWPDCRSPNPGMCARYYHFNKNKLSREAYNELKEKQAIRRNADKSFPSCDHEIIFPFLARELGYEIHEGTGEKEH